MILARVLLVVLALITAPLAAQAQDFNTPPAAGETQVLPEGVADLPVFHVNKHEVDWWDSGEDGFDYRVFLMLNGERGDALYELSTEHVGEEIAVYFNGRFLGSFVVPDVITDGTLSLKLDGDHYNRLLPALPKQPEDAKKPRTRIMKIP